MGKIGIIRSKNQVMKKEFVGYVGEYSDTWVFETEDQQYSSNVPATLDELLDTETKDGEKYRITIEKL